MSSKAVGWALRMISEAPEALAAGTAAAIG